MNFLKHKLYMCARIYFFLNSTFFLSTFVTANVRVMEADIPSGPVVPLAADLFTYKEYLKLQRASTASSGISMAG